MFYCINFIVNTPKNKPENPGFLMSKSPGFRILKGQVTRLPENLSLPSLACMVSKSIIFQKTVIEGQHLNTIHPFTAM